MRATEKLHKGGKDALQKNDCTPMSSKKARTHVLNKGLRVEFIVPWKEVGAPQRPKDITLNSKWPK